MNPVLRHSRRLRLAAWLPPARRLLPCVVVAVGIALATPADAQQAADGTYGPVRRADTLWELALRFRGDARVNAQQAMIAILRANPGAFVEGNINALRTGVTLRVPSSADMAAISPGEAAAEFARHEEAWRNRRSTGSAAPGPQAPSRPASPPADAAPGGGEDVAEELRKVRATVADMRDRLAERDEAIEDLLVQLAAARRELRAVQAVAPAPSDETTGGDEGAPGADSASRTSWLPVSPLILGSSLIVLLVLIVVVTLLRQRGDAEDAQSEDPFEDGEEGSYDEEYDPEPYDEGEIPDSHDRADDADDLRRGGEALRGEERDEWGPSRPRPAAAVAGPALAGGAVTAHELASDDEAGEPRRADLPIGMDLEGDEDWDRGPEDPSEVRMDSGEDPGSASDFHRHIEVGELDDLELDVDPEPGGYPDVPAGPGEEDDPSPGARRHRRE